MVDPTGFICCRDCYIYRGYANEVLLFQLLELVYGQFKCFSFFGPCLQIHMHVHYLAQYMTPEVFRLIYFSRKNTIKNSVNQV